MPFIGLSNTVADGNTAFKKIERTYTSTGGETRFNIEYTANSVEVYLNGIKLLKNTDFYATTGTYITLVQPTSNGDVINCVGYQIKFELQTAPLPAYFSKNVLNEDVTVNADENAMLIGPVTINSTIIVNGTLTII